MPEPINQDSADQNRVAGVAPNNPGSPPLAQSLTPDPTEQSAPIVDPPDPTADLTPNNDDSSSQLERIETSLAAILKKSDSTDFSLKMKQGISDVMDDLRDLRDHVKRLASEESVANIKGEWKDWQNQTLQILSSANSGIDGSKTTFIHAVNQLKKDTETQYKSNLEGERRRADDAEDKVLESVVYPLHDAAFKISCDIESGGKIAEGQSVCNLLEVLESNLRESLDICVFRPSPGEQYRSDCMKPVGQEKTSLFFRKADTVANTTACGFYRDGGASEPRFLRKASVVVYRDKRSAAIPNPAPSPSPTITQDSSTEA